MSNNTLGFVKLHKVDTDCSISLSSGIGIGSLEITNVKPNVFAHVTPRGLPPKESSAVLLLSLPLGIQVNVGKNKGPKAQN